MLTKPLRLKSHSAVSNARVVVQVDPEEINLSDRFVSFIEANRAIFGDKTPTEILEEVRGKYRVASDTEHHRVAAGTNQPGD